MTILLTTALTHSPGHGAADETYGEVKVLSFRVWITKAKLEIVTNYGNTVEGVWVGGKTHPLIVVVADHDNTIPATTDYTDLMLAAQCSEAGALLYNEVAESLYQYLLDQELYAGTVQ